jgi:hypothetical protein
MRVFVLISASLKDYNQTPIFSMQRNAKAFCVFSKRDVQQHDIPSPVNMIAILSLQGKTLKSNQDPSTCFEYQFAYFQRLNGIMI